MIKREIGPVKNIDIPIIDLQDENNLTSQIMKASQDFGIFLVINHGIPKEQMENAMKIFEEFFNLPQEELGKYPLECDKNKVCRVYTSSYNYEAEEVHYWRDALRVECTPLDECMKYWPQKPENFKNDIGEYVKAGLGLRLRILEHLSLGLGLGRGYLGGELCEDVSLTVNYYPPSPDPSVTLGLPRHLDATIITIMQSSNVPGLQFLKDEQWFGVECPPGAFMVFMGSQIEVISNGELKGLPHRVVSNVKGRYSVLLSIHPTQKSFIEPAKTILEAQNIPPRYRGYPYKEFYEAFQGPRLNGKEIDDVVNELLTKS